MLDGSAKRIDDDFVDVYGELTKANLEAAQLEDPAAESFGANETARTFAGAFMNAAIDINPDDQKLI